VASKLSENGRITERYGHQIEAMQDEVRPQRARMDELGAHRAARAGATT
jgi:hypothetical protein